MKTTVTDCLRDFRESIEPLVGKGEAQSISRIVFEDALKVFDLTSDKALPTEQVQLLNQIKERLLQKEPVQYILGQADFYGLKFLVDKNVLIPRAETEELVFWIVESFSKDTTIHLIDIGTGSGCIPITIKKKRPSWKIEAIDISAGALEVAQSNATLNKAPVRFSQLDFLSEKARSALGKFDVIVSNPPYIPNREDHLVPDLVKNYEPSQALFVADDDPLVFYRNLALFAISHLHSGGYLFVETNEFNASEVVDLFAKAGLTEVELAKDISGKERMVRGRLAT